MKKLHRARFRRGILPRRCRRSRTALAQPAPGRDAGAAPPAQPPPARRPDTQPAAPPPAGQPRPQPARPERSRSFPTQEAALPPGYVIGPDDVLTIIYWRNKDMSAEVTVRPDGRSRCPLLNEVQAAGLTPDQFREKVIDGRQKFVEEPDRHRGRQGDQQPQGLHHGHGREAGAVPADGPDDGDAADLDGRRHPRVRGQQEHHDHAQRERRSRCRIRSTTRTS